jgi:hypothetical protein
LAQGIIGSLKRGKYLPFSFGKPTSNISLQGEMTSFWAQTKISAKGIEFSATCNAV